MPIFLLCLGADKSAALTQLHCERSGARRRTRPRTHARNESTRHLSSRAHKTYIGRWRTEETVYYWQGICINRAENKFTLRGWKSNLTTLVISFMWGITDVWPRCRKAGSFQKEFFCNIRSMEKKICINFLTEDSLAIENAVSSRSDFSCLIVIPIILSPTSAGLIQETSYPIILSRTASVALCEDEVLWMMGFLGGVQWQGCDRILVRAQSADVNQTLWLCPLIHLFPAQAALTLGWTDPFALP